MATQLFKVSKAKELDLEMRKGERLPLRIKITVKSTGDMLDLTGYTFRMPIKRRFRDKTPALELTLGHGLEVNEGYLMVDQNIDLPVGTYEYDLKSMDPFGEPKDWLFGKIFLTEN